MRIIDHYATKQQEYQCDMGFAFGKSKYNHAVTENMMPTDISEFSNQVDDLYPIIEAYVLHVIAHRKQNGFEHNSCQEADINFAEFYYQDKLLKQAQ